MPFLFSGMLPSRFLPPPSFKTAELGMATKILRLATNFFDTESVLRLVLFGGPRLPRPLAYAIACMTSASFKTLAGFEAQHQSLLERRERVFGCLCWRSDNAFPDGWGSLTFCSNLIVARHGDLANTFFPGSTSSILAINRKLGRHIFKNGLKTTMYESLLA